MSLNAWGFLLFSPYTHHWPMTHQPLHLHSKPLFHYLNHEASFLEGWRANLRRLTVYHCGPSSCKWRTQDSEHVHSSEYCTCCAFFLAGCAQRSCREAPRRAGLQYLPASVARWNPELCANLRHVLSRDIYQRRAVSPFNNLSSVVWFHSWAHFPLNILTQKQEQEHI